MMFILIYQRGTDGDLTVEPFHTMNALQQRVREMQLTYLDYAVVEGHVVKGFSQRLKDSM